MAVMCCCSPVHYLSCQQMHVTRIAALVAFPAVASVALQLDGSQTSPSLTSLTSHVNGMSPNTGALNGIISQQNRS